MAFECFRSKSWFCFQRLWVLFAFILMFCLVVFGQERKRNLGLDDVIRLETTLVQVPVVVSDKGRRYITDLKREDFSIYEGGVKQQVEFFRGIDEPFTVALVLDCSGSTTDQLELIKGAAVAFVECLRDKDRVMVISFADSVEVLSDFTSEKSILRRAIARIHSGEFTQVYEAVYTAVWEEMGDVGGRKAVIVFTDGVDTASSEIDKEDTLDAVIEREDVIVYPIRYNTRPDVERKIALKNVDYQSDWMGGLEVWVRERRRELDRVYREADEYLHLLAENSGGLIERADEIGDLKCVFERIAEELRHQYLIGYYPVNKQADGGERHIEVEVSRPDVMVRVRPNYRR